MADSSINLPPDLCQLNTVKPIKRLCKNPECGKKIIGRTRKATTCSHQCHIRLQTLRKTAIVLKAREGRSCAREGCENSIAHLKIGSLFCSRECRDKTQQSENLAKRISDNVGKICASPFCNNHVLSTHLSAKFCCNKCCHDYYQKVTVRPRKYDRTCEHCGNKIPDERNLHAKFCSPRCMKIHNGKMSNLKLRPRTIRQCGVCHIDISHKRLSAKYCGKSCLLLAGNTRHNKVKIRPKPEECENPFCRRKGHLRFDHNHATGNFRGWLCHSCNIMLGIAKDQPNYLRWLANYVEQHSYENPLEKHTTALVDELTNQSSLS